MNKIVLSESRCAFSQQHSAVYRDRPRSPNELKTAITAYIINFSQTYLQKVFANKLKRFQAWIGARGHHFKQLL
jgi:23S rRNA maturation-related 3'-5' exoribonuclease YhaM